MLVLHFVPDGVRCLDPCLDVVLDAFLVEGFPDGCREAFKQVVAIVLGELQLFLDVYIY